MAQNVRSANKKPCALDITSTFSGLTWLWFHRCRKLRFYHPTSICIDGIGSEWFPDMRSLRWTPPRSFHREDSMMPKNCHFLKTFCYMPHLFVFFCLSLPYIISSVKTRAENGKNLKIHKTNASELTWNYNRGTVFIGFWRFNCALCRFHVLLHMAFVIRLTTIFWDSLFENIDMRITGESALAGLGVWLLITLRCHKRAYYSDNHGLIRKLLERAFVMQSEFSFSTRWANK